ncbi:methyltransferase domain-containing protein [Methanocella arvoryzae]|uniref:RNA methyltransferase n=1 Tax=Methanocella arvoryzae (strain DSM 22066 / NBRC 105507 / MRE50) TaxID=351160 RepID=Q0W550_METAR|nr:methyltransferase domain-containing protein [Methanocella arvoryzae]CAJ36493.1 putative RNA methyltransferase [Methanocella arvoryzae MRE50]
MDPKSRAENPNEQIYMATTVPGIEDVAAGEMQSKLGGLKVLTRKRGKIFFRFDRSYEELFSLRCVDNLYYYLGSFEIGPHKADLAEIPRKLAKLGLRPRLERLYGDLSARSVIVSGSRTGKHTYSRYQAADALLDALVRVLGFRRGSVEAHDLHFRIDVEGGSAFLHVKLTPATFRYRGQEKQFLSAALKASVAHAMVLISMPRPDDIFLDPFCGSGTILAERASCEAKAIIGSDISPERLEIARQNLPGSIRIDHRDARHTGLPSGSVNKIVSNLPWGKQIEVGDVDQLYVEFLAEAKRLLAPGGLMVLLTDQEEAITRAAESCGLHIEKRCTLSLHGLHPSIYLIKKS